MRSSPVKTSLMAVLLWVLTLVLYPAGLFSEVVRATEGTISIPIYDWLPADPNPRFFELEGQPIYPYPRLEFRSAEKTARTFKTITLENDYLQIICLPELCGRIQSIRRKSTGEEILYRSEVIKPGLISLNGAWFPGGIEWNRGPYGHTLNMMLPVDTAIASHSDGSVTLHIGATEQTYHTRWRVALTLRPGSACLEESFQLIQPTDTLATYYFWNCVAFPATPETQFILPVSLVLNDETHQHEPWPIHEGLDKSYLKNYPHRNSVYPVGGTQDFFGVYDATIDRGVAQWADHRELTGKKLWTWGQDDSGKQNMASMTDAGGGEYLEFQTGPTETQNDVGRFYPGQLIQWREWWYPVEGLGDGFDFATREIAVNLTKQDEGLRVSLSPAREFKKSKITISRGEQVLLKTEADLEPMKAWSGDLKIEEDKDIRVRILSDEGNVLLDFTSPLKIPVVEAPNHAPASDEKQTLQEQMTAADQMDRRSQWNEASVAYEKILSADSSFVPAIIARAELDLRMGRLEQAAERLRKACRLAPEDSNAARFLAAALLRLRPSAGQETEAELKALAADKSLPPGMAGRCWMRLGMHDRALTAFETASAAEPENPTFADLKLAALLALDDKTKLRDQVSARLETDPLDSFARVIDWLSAEKNLESVASPFGNFDQTLLDTALDLNTLTLHAEGLRILEARLKIGPSTGANLPLLAYLAAYLANIQGDPQSTGKYLDAAAKFPPDLVFPSRVELLPVLEWAAAKRPDDSQAIYYLAHLLAGLHRSEDALPVYEKAATANPALSAAWRTLGQHIWRKKNDLFKAAEFYNKAVAASPGDTSLLIEFAEVQAGLGERQKAIAILKAAPADAPRTMQFSNRLARWLLEEKQYEEALSILFSTKFRLSYGLTEQHDIFKQIHLQRGEELLAAGKMTDALADFEAALTYPEALKVGREPGKPEAKIQYLRGKALHGLGRPEEAKAAWTEATAGAPGDEDQNKFRELASKALKTGQPE